MSISSHDPKDIDNGDTQTSDPNSSSEEEEEAMTLEEIDENLAEISQAEKEMDKESEEYIQLSLVKNHLIDLRKSLLQLESSEKSDASSLPPPLETLEEIQSKSENIDTSTQSFPSDPSDISTSTPDVTFKLHYDPITGSKVANFAPTNKEESVLDPRIRDALKTFSISSDIFQIPQHLEIQRSDTENVIAKKQKKIEKLKKLHEKSLNKLQRDANTASWKKFSSNSGKIGNPGLGISDNRSGKIINKYSDNPYSLDFSSSGPSGPSQYGFSTQSNTTTYNNNNKNKIKTRFSRSRTRRHF